MADREDRACGGSDYERSKYLQNGNRIRGASRRRLTVTSADTFDTVWSRKLSTLLQNDIWARASRSFDWGNYLALEPAHMLHSLRVWKTPASVSSLFMSCIPLSSKNICPSKTPAITTVVISGTINTILLHRSSVVNLFITPVHWTSRSILFLVKRRN